jgi:hypothetical protein
MAAEGVATPMVRQVVRADPFTGSLGLVPLHANCFNSKTHGQKRIGNTWGGLGRGRLGGGPVYAWKVSAAGSGIPGPREIKLPGLTGSSTYPPLKLDVKVKGPGPSRLIA